MSLFDLLKPEITISSINIDNEGRKIICNHKPNSVILTEGLITVITRCDKNIETGAISLGRPTKFKKYPDYTVKNCGICI